MSKGTVFLSDLHLGDVRWAHQDYRLFEDFTENFVNKYAARVVVAGDMLEWIQYGLNSIAHCLSPLLRLLQLSLKGIPIYLVVGNHDIDFCAISTPDLPIKIIYPRLHLEIDGYSFHIEHGHFYDPTISLLPGAARFFTAHGGRLLDKLPHGVEDALGAFKQDLLKAVTLTTGQKSASFEEICRYRNAAAALARSQSGIHDYVVFGHTHRAELVPLGVSGKTMSEAIYVNCGDWQVHSDFAFFVDGTMHLLCWNSDREKAITIAEGTNLVVV